MREESDVFFDVKGPLGVVTLNRPKALNALTLDMIEAFDAQLAAWGGDEAIAAVVAKGAGDRAYCAGGDVRAIWDAGKSGDPLTADFFRGEYTLNRRIKVLPKPFIALVDGIAMGGGVGVSVHGSQRVATERTVIAMPETKIGLFPDVGGSYFLPRLPGALGMYLALTGQRMKGADALYTTLATHYIESGKLEAVETALAAADWSAAKPTQIANAVLDRFAQDPGEAPLAAHRAVIDRCFAGESVEAIIGALESEAGAWADKALDVLRACSPTSLKVTFEELRRGAELDFDSAMTMEYRLSQAFMAGHDFYEGVRAVVIDKDNAPAWDPASLDAVTPDMIEAHFKPLGARDLSFD